MEWTIFICDNIQTAQIQYKKQYLPKNTNLMSKIGLTYHSKF